MSEMKITGYPSIDKPWLKYYSEEMIYASLPMCTMYEYIFNNNNEHLNDIALIYFGRKITYKKLFEYIDQAAASFVKLGVEKGDIVTIQSLSLPQVVVIIYALSKIGAVANLIYANANISDIKANLKETGSRVFVVMEPIFNGIKKEIVNEKLDAIIVMGVQDEMDFITKTVFCIASKTKNFKSTEHVLSWKDFYKFEKEKSVPVVGHSDDPVVMVYTGGTTGKSKAVVLSNFNLNVGALQYVHLGFERHKIMLSALPPFIAFGITVTLHTPLAFGLKTALCVGADATKISGFVEKYKPNYIICGTAQAETMMSAFRNKKTDLSYLHCLSVGGDVLHEKLEEELNEFLISHNARIQVAQGYAMSETAASTAASTRTIDNTVYKKGTVGVPLVYTNIKILNPDTGEMMQYGQNGEICIYSPCMMMGYYNNQEETNHMMRLHDDGLTWIHTGDIGNVDEDGFITIVGRIKRMIMTYENGVFHKVFPKLLEDELLKIEGIKGISIVGKSRVDDTMVNDLICYVELEDNISEETVLVALKQAAEEKFDSYERPYRYIVIKKLPRTTIGKIDYRKLEKEASMLSF